jgi:endonuclease-8
VPEGDTVHTAAAYLRKRLAGTTAQGGRVRHRPDIRLAGRRIDDVVARGKHLFVKFDDGTVLRSHLGMFGSWHRYRAGETWRRPARQAVIRIETGGEVYVCFNAKEVELLRAGGVSERRLAARLGPDLIADEVDPGDLAARARHFLPADMLIADALLDQRPAAGIGNVYKCELLFLGRTHPRTPLGAVSDERLRRFYAEARALLRRNVGGGRRVTRFVRDGRGTTWVYGRLGMPCHECGSRVAYERLGRQWRSTYWCPECQPAPAP